MRAVVQRTKRASVRVEGQIVGAIEEGLCVLVGVGPRDDAADAEALAEKVAGLRIFEDAGGKMNLSVQDMGGAVLAVSQFTLWGDARKGRRPSFVQAREPLEAERLFDHFCKSLRDIGLEVQTGRFGAHMEVELCNDGPVTLLLDTEKVF